MKKFEIEINLNHIRDARAELNKKVREFNTECDKAMKRLIHEAAANMMSAQEVGKHAGMSTAAVKTKMKKFNLNPSKGKTLLSKNAAEVLASNAEIMGIEPHQIDLMSPLAYLPAGKDVSAFLETPPITEVPEDTLAPWLHQRFGAPWEKDKYGTLTADDKAYWEHTAAAVRRAVARGGFKNPTQTVEAGL